MSPLRSTFAVLFGFALLVALAVAAYLFFQDIYQYLQALDRQVAAGIVAGLVAALYIGLSIRRAGKFNGVQQLRLKGKAESYSRFLSAWSGTTAEQGGDSQPEAASAEINAAIRDLLLWAGAGVIKQLRTYLRMNPRMMLSDPASRSHLENLLRAMRSDLGDNSLGLSESDLTSLLTPEGPESSKSSKLVESATGER